MRRSMLLLAAGGSTIAAATAADSSPRPHAARTVWDSVYSATQAARGETAYVKACARCHKESLGGADESPAIAGAGFLANWNGESVGSLHERIRTTMPPDEPESLNRQLVTDVTAYLLKMNGFPAGAAEMPADADSLEAIAIRASKP